MKKFFTFVSAALLTFSMQAAETIEVDGIYYQLNDDQTATLLPAQAPATIYDQESIVVPVSVSKDEVEYPVVALAKAAFKQSTASSITFAEGSNVTAIGMQAFQRANNIKELVLPEGIKLIPVTGIHSDQDPATEPMALERLVLPASVDSLAMMSVVASNLAVIEFKGTVPPGCCHKYIAATDYYQVPWEISAKSKNFTSKDCLILVPKGAVEAYKAAPGIGDYFTLIADVLKDTVLVDGLYYEMDNVARKATIIQAQNEAQKYEQESIVIPAFVSEGGREFPVVALARKAFYNSTAKSITFAEGSNVTEIGMQSFQAVVDLLELELPEGIKLIPTSGIHNSTVSNPMKMKKLVLPASLDSLAVMAIALPQLETLEFKGSIPPHIATKVTNTWTQNPWQISTTHACNTNKEAIVIVPKGSLEAYQNTAWIGDYFTTIQEAEDTATAVENVSNNNAFRSGVYSITGCYLGEDATNLPKGMYIINGQKVIR